MKRIITLIKQHDEASFGIGLLIAAILVGTFIYSYMHHLHTKARNQAVARARKMDGTTFTISDVSWNFVGDTKLILKNDCGQNVGSIMMYMANPLDGKVNPLSLAFTDPYGQLPFPMKVKAHFRQNPWALKYDGSTRETFTGSFIEFEVL